MSKDVKIIVTRISGGVEVDVSRIGVATVKLSSTRKPIGIFCSRINVESLELSVIRKGAPLVTCNIINPAYLKVEPQVIWAVPEGTNVYVTSNVDWIIV